MSGEDFFLCEKCGCEIASEESNEADRGSRYEGSVLCNDCYAEDHHKLKDKGREMETPEPKVDVTETYRKMHDALVCVLHMRKAQREYFRTKKKEDLIEAKRLEAAVDLRLGELGIR